MLKERHLDKEIKNTIKIIFMLLDKDEILLSRLI